MSDIQRIPVVATFLRSNDKIALIKRSDEVSTHCGKWAAFSGYVERLPLNQAWLELWEEAGVDENQVRLTGIGIPVPIDEQSLGGSWLVFPYLFDLKDGAEVRTNWEADEIRWVTPEEVCGLDTVPGLETVLARVWPAFGDEEFWEGMAHIATNTDDCAMELAKRGLEALGGYVQENEAKIDNAVLVSAIRALSASRPSMGVFPNLAARLLLAMQREGGQYDFDELVTGLLDMVDDTTEMCVNETARALRGAKRVLTVGGSETVGDVILTWNGSDCEALVAVSDMRCEGNAMANHLSKSGVTVTTVPQTDLLSAVKTVDAVVVECVAISAGCELLARLGTRTAVDAANEAGVPVFAIAQTVKIMPQGWPVFLERQAPSDYDDTSTEFTGPVVLDITPIDLFDAVITEDGPLRPSRFAEIIAELGEVELIPGG